jgi:hypothetical protein
MKRSTDSLAQRLGLAQIDPFGVWVARYETHHWCFEACGATREDAIASLRYGLRVHAKERNLLAGEEWYCVDDFIVRFLPIGVTLRDGERMGGAA